MIKWNGIGEPTKNLDRHVRVKLRDDQTFSTRVGDVLWTHRGNVSDIVAYEWLENAPVAERTGMWMQTAGGRAYWPIDPRPEEVFIEDIAHHLSMLVRYTGAVSRFYSVAEHSVLLSRLVPTEYALDALMHDATEAYVNDLGRAVKYDVELAGYRAVEARNWVAIAARFNLRIEPPDMALVHDRLTVSEKMALFGRPPLPSALDNVSPATVKIDAWHPPQAHVNFLQRYWELTT